MYKVIISTILMICLISICLSATAVAKMSEPPNISDASDWARDEISSAYAKGFLISELQSNYKQDVTRGEFVRLAMSWLKYNTGLINSELVTEHALFPDRTFNDTDDNDILAAGKLGIIEGTGSGAFDELMTFDRQQAAVVLARIQRIIFGENTDNASDYGFIDIDRADIWAQSSINYVAANGVMQGIENGIFNPHGSFSREMSILVFERFDIKYGNPFVDKPPFAGGTGSADDPYRIANEEQLRNIEQHLSMRNDDAHFILVNDIGLTSGWIPIGAEKVVWNAFDDVFFGTLDGNGHTIRNMIINVESDDILDSGVTILECGSMADVSASGDPGFFNAVGGIVGSAYEGSSIINTYSAGSVSSSDGYASIGGIVGRAECYLITCYTTARIEAAYALSNTETNGLVGTIRSIIVVKGCGVFNVPEPHFISSDYLNDIFVYNTVGTYSLADSNTYKSLGDSDWDFDSIWAFSAFGSYNYPVLQNIPEITQIAGLA